MSRDSKSVVPYSAYRATFSRGRYAFLASVPIIGGLVFNWAFNKGMDEGLEAAKQRWKDAEPTQPDYVKELEFERARVREEQARNQECLERLKEANARVKHYEDEESRTVIAIKWPKY